jgi:hypothetical protein
MDNYGSCKLENFRPMNETIRYSEQLAHREYVVYGANAEILICLRESGVLNEVFPPEIIEKGVLVRALASSDYSERIFLGSDCVLALWRKWVPYGPFPLLRELSKFEFDRAFYPGYRDHSTHQLKVALLGLYIYETCSALRSHIDGILGGRLAFLSRWLPAALAHDIGYVFEAGDATKHTQAAVVAKSLNNLSANALSEYIKWKTNSTLLPAQEEELRRLIGVPARNITCFDDLLNCEPNGGLLRPLEPLAHPTRLAVGNTPLKTYLNYARAISPNGQNRGPYIDHGIASACILLFVYKVTLRQMYDLARGTYGPEPLPYLDPGLLSSLPDLTETETALHDAAVAVALHNISPAFWDHDNAFRWGDGKLTLQTFRIPMTTMPIAALLAIVDSIQEWDRPRFSSPMGDADAPDDVNSQDLHIIPCRTGLGICYPADKLAGTGDKDSRFSSLVSCVNEYVSEYIGILPVCEVTSQRLPEMVRTFSWGSCILQAEDGVANPSILSSIPKGMNEIAIDLYRQGRSLANKSAWLPSMECHKQSAELFQRAGSSDWAARSWGRVAFNCIDLNRFDEASFALDRSYELDYWQGAANFYWSSVHFARGVEASEFARDQLVALIRGLFRFPELAGQVQRLEDAPASDTYQRYVETLVRFFEELVAREIRAGWPNWAMSDVGRMYALRVEYSPDVAVVLLESAAKAYCESELSSYHSWYMAKSWLLRTSRSTSAEDMLSSINDVLTSLGGVVQRPGKSNDAASLATILCTALRSSLIFLFTRNQETLQAAKAIISSREEVASHLLFTSTHSVIEEVENIVSNGGIEPSDSVIAKIQSLCARIAALDETRMREKMEAVIVAAIDTVRQERRTGGADV